MLMMVEKGIRGGMCEVTHRYVKASNKYMRKKYDKNIELSYLIYFDANNLYGWTMSQKLPVNRFKWVKDLSRFNQSFIKNYDEISVKGYFLEVDVEYPKKLFNFHNDLPFLPERKKYKNAKSLFVPYKTKKIMFFLHKLHKCIKTSIKWWINSKNVAQNNSV